MGEKTQSEADKIIGLFNGKAPNPDEIENRDY